MGWNEIRARVLALGGNEMDAGDTINLLPGVDLPGFCVWDISRAPKIEIRGDRGVGLTADGPGVINLALEVLGRR
jgi:hypothetical protein